MNNVKSPGLSQLSCRSVGQPGIWGPHSHTCVPHRWGAPVSQLPACSVLEGWGSRSPHRIEDGLNKAFLLFEEKKMAVGFSTDPRAWMVRSSEIRKAPESWLVNVFDGLTLCWVERPEFGPRMKSEGFGAKWTWGAVGFSHIYLCTVSWFPSLWLHKTHCVTHRIFFIHLSTDGYLNCFGIWNCSPYCRPLIG